MSEWKHRTTEQARDALSRFCTRKPVMTIPVDRERDADMILGDVIEERDSLLLQVRDLHEWAREQARSHHNISVERMKDSEEMSGVHNALSSAYFRLADEIEKRASVKQNPACRTCGSPSGGAELCPACEIMPSGKKQDGDQRDRCEKDIPGSPNGCDMMPGHRGACCFYR